MVDHAPAISIDPGTPPWDLVRARHDDGSTVPASAQCHRVPRNARQTLAVDEYTRGSVKIVPSPKRLSFWFVESSPRLRLPLYREPFVSRVVFRSCYLIVVVFNLGAKSLSSSPIQHAFRTDRWLDSGPGMSTRSFRWCEVWGSKYCRIRFWLLH